MSCILHTIGANVTFDRNVNWSNKSTGAKGTVAKGETAVIRSIDKQNHKLVVEIKSTGFRLTVDASLFETGGTHSHET